MALIGRTVDRIRAGLGGRVVHGVLWGAGALLLGRGLHILGMMAAAPILGPERFGELTIVYTTFAALDSVLLGLSMTATKFVAELRETAPGRAGRTIALVNIIALGIGLVVALGLASLAREIATHLLANPALEPSLRLAAALIPLSVWFQAQNGVLVGLGAFRGLAAVNLWTGMGVFAGISLGAANAGVLGAVAGLFAGTLVGAIGSRIAVRREAHRHAVPLLWRFSRAELPLLWRFSLPAILEGMLWWPATWLASLILVRQPDGYFHMGLYSAAFQWFAALSFVSVAVNRVLLVFMAERIGRAADRDAIRLARQALLGLGSLLLPSALLVGLASPAIMRLYGPEFAEGWAVLTVLSFAACASACFAPFGSVLTVRGRMWARTGLTVVAAATLLLLAVVLTPSGAIGLAIATAVAYSLRIGLVALIVGRDLFPHTLTPGTSHDHDVDR